MVENGPELKGPKGGISDKLISLKVRVLEKPAPEGHFSERVNPNPESEGIVKEKDLPVVKEALEILGEAKESGRLVARAENPFGQISSFKMDVVGDVHVTGSYPEESVESRSPALRAFQEIGPRSREAKRRPGKVPEELKSKFSTVQEYMESGDYVEPVTEVNGFEGTGANWSDEIRPSMSVQSFRALGEAIVTDISQNAEYLGPDSATVIVDIGDKSNTESTEGDIAMNAIEWERLRKKAEITARDVYQKPTNETSLERFQRERNEHLLSLKAGTTEERTDSEPRIGMTCPEGNHDSDLNNKGLDNEAIKRELYGSQIFIQEVGDEHVVLAINTNFESSFWWKNFQIQKKKASTNDEKSIIAGIEEEIKLQREIIQKAKQSGRKIVVLAHEAELVNQALDLQKSRVTHIVSGHLHESKNEPMKETNADGDNVRLVRVGSTFIGMPGWEKVKNPVGFSVTIKKSDSGQEMVDVSEIEIPDKVKASLSADY